MDKYNGKTVRFKGNKHKIVKNTISMMATENLNIERFFESSIMDFVNAIYITEVDQILKISDKLYQIESSEKARFCVKITEKDIEMSVDDILNVFLSCSTNYIKKYIRDCDVTKYSFYMKVKYIAFKKTNFMIEDCNENLNLRYEVKIKGTNDYSHDSSKKFPLNVLDSDIPRCISPDWYLWQNDYVNFINDNYYEKKEHVTNRRNNINEIKIQMLEVNIEKIA